MTFNEVKNKEILECHAGEFKNISNIYLGMLKGLTELGAKHAKTDLTHIYLDIAIGSDIDDNGKLQRANKAIYRAIGLKLKIRRVK